MQTLSRRILAFVFALGLASIAQAELFNFSSTIQMGSWQEREQVTTNAKGKVTDLSVIWLGIVDTEERAGKSYLWLETRTQSFKTTRKGQRKPKGAPMIMKTLVEESAFGDSKDPMMSLRQFSEEIIFQSGNSDPMRIREGGVMAETMLKSFGGNMQFELDPNTSTETVTVPAGSFDTVKISGSGSMEVNAIVRKFHVESQAVSWYSKEVPLGIVRQEVASTTNGKVSNTKSELLRHGDNGAQSMINNATVQDMPSFGLGRNR